MAGIRAIRAALPVMLADGGGSIVNVGSLNARLPDPRVLDYSAAKAAFDTLAKGLSKEFGPQGIRINTIDPGPVSTDLWLGGDGVAVRLGAARDQSAEQVVQATAENMITRRFSTPQEIADLVLVLASNRFANVLGANVVIDGGMAPML
jgi:NAD(P)-dependent dehydrogenase (short-subunit alcohol dehydrogenase family)